METPANSVSGVLAHLPGLEYCPLVGIHISIGGLLEINQTSESERG